MNFKKELEEFVGKKVTITKVDGDVQKGMFVISLGLPHMNAIVKDANGVKKFIRGSEISELIIEDDKS